MNVNERGYIPVDKQLRTNVAAHPRDRRHLSASRCSRTRRRHEGKIAAEVIAGHKAYFDARTIPSVAYTDPEIAWMGLTEAQAQGAGRRIREGGVSRGRRAAARSRWRATTA